MMRLIGGPCNRKIVHDTGTTEQKMLIKSKDEFGYATYEPNEERTHSFWLGNTWIGKNEKIYTSDFRRV
jgi:hypothetical protein